VRTVSLAHSTGHELADHVVREMVTRFEEAFPNRISGYYAEGSYADQSAVATSDLDLTLVLHSPVTTPAEQKLVSHLIAACEQSSPIELDITLTDVQQLQQSADPMFKLGACLLYGTDIRDTIPLMPITLWARQRMHAAFWLMVHIFHRRQPIAAPLPYPDSGDAFYGYATRTMRLADGTEIYTTRNLIRVTGWIATARIAYQAHQYVVRKRECVCTYRRAINDAWTSLLDAIDQRCRTAWQYRIPETRAERAELRDITAQTLGFENHFLNIYQQFLVAELASSDPTAQHMALEALARTWYPHAALLYALEQLLSAPDADLCATAHNVLNQQRGC
jgi:hypothetical protein